MLNLCVTEAVKRYRNMYSKLYEAKSTVKDYDKAVSFGDKILSSEPDFINAFVQENGDFVSSNREAAALGFTVSGMLKEKGIAVPGAVLYCG